jgi:Tol biopolymer transport system component
MKKPVRKVQNHLLQAGVAVMCAAFLFLLIFILRLFTGNEAGDRLYFYSDRVLSGKNSSGGLYVMNMNKAGEAKPLIGGIFDDSFACSPDGNKIAFTQANDQRGVDIYIMETAGGDTINATEGYGENYCREWSPDGKKLAFERLWDGYMYLYAMDQDGKNKLRLTTENTNSFRPVWSPAGGKIIFTRQIKDSDDKITYEIYIMNSDGTGTKKIAIDPAAGYRWSPKGGKIAFIRILSGKSEIFSVNKDGNGLLNLTKSPADGYMFDWSPDGKKIAFSRFQDRTSQIYLMNEDGSGKKMLTAAGTDNFGPIWSKNGSRIAFVSNRDGNQEIYIMNIDGSKQLNMTKNPANDWRPVCR